MSTEPHALRSLLSTLNLHHDLKCRRRLTTLESLVFSEKTQDSCGKSELDVLDCRHVREKHGGCFPEADELTWSHDEDPEGQIGCWLSWAWIRLKIQHLSKREGDESNILGSFR